MAKIKVKKTKPMTLAYIEHIGDYGDIPFDEYISQLYEWVKKQKVRPGFKAIGIYHDNPEEKPPAECRSEIGIPIKGVANPEGEIKIKEIPALDVAVIKHKAPASMLQETYHDLTQWIEGHGYEWNGPGIEVYTKKPKVVGGRTILYATVQAPVKKKT